VIAHSEELRRYQDHLPGYDEALSPEGGLQPEWRGLLEEVLPRSPEERRGWSDLLSRELRQDGLTFALGGEERLMGRGDRIDPLPWILSAQEWKGIEAGLEQRARLLEAVSRDLNGEQTLIKRGILPAELIYGDPSYLRPCVGLPTNMARQLFMMAVDLARGPDGRMWVLEDRTQAPSGAGYALESRTLLGRLFPELLSRLHVRRLSGYFRGLRESMLELFEGRRLEPRVVMLSPGPYSATYFEHAYLATYLGYTLVQGDDLLVRDGALFLKTLEGLEPVDIVIRRVDAPFCDPLELRRDSFLGVPGLLGAMRNGRVACLNHPGSGVMENRGLQPFLPRIAKELLGEDLNLPSAATWWCGQPTERSHVLEHLDSLVLKPVQRHHGEDTQFGWLLSEKERKELRARIEANPQGWVGQENIGFSTVPLLSEGQLEPRRSVLRCFASANSGSYRVMPGGLGRSAPVKGSPRVSMRQGGIYKDVWVLGSEEEASRHDSLWLNTGRRGHNADSIQGVFTSRSAEQLFWVGRYAERVAQQCSLFRILLRVRGGQEEEPRLMLPMLELLERSSGLWHVDEEEKPESSEDRLNRVLHGEGLAGSLKQNLQMLLSAAYAVRDIWSQDSWRLLIGMEEGGTRCCDESLSDVELLQAVDALLEKGAAFLGLNLAGMTRESGWVMLMMGRYLERGLGLCELGTVLAGIEEESSEEEQALLDVLLLFTENQITYRRHYRTTPRRVPVMELLYVSEVNPRSLIFQFRELSELMLKLPEPPIGSLDDLRLNLNQQRARWLENGWRRDTERTRFLELIDGSRSGLELSSLRLSEVYFRHSSSHQRERF